MSEITIGNLKAIAFHLRQGKVNGGIPMEALAGQLTCAADELTTTRATAAKAMADYETANHALANCKAVAEIQSERVRKLEAELAAMAATAHDYKLQTCKPDECRVIETMNQKLSDAMDANNKLFHEGVRFQAERDALIAENQWHLASDIKPPYNVTVMTSGRLGLSFGIWDCNKWYVFDCDDNSTSEWIDFLPTHWRLLPHPSKGQP